MRSSHPTTKASTFKKSGTASYVYLKNIVEDLPSQTKITIWTLRCVVFTMGAPNIYPELNFAIMYAVRQKHNIAQTQQQQQTDTNNNMETTDISTDIQAEVPLQPMPSTLVAKANDNLANHSLYDMLERFVFIETFQWKTGDVVLPLQLTQNNYINNVKTSVKQYDLPQALLDASRLTRQKLNNFMLMKADMEIDVKVNTNPFQQGELLVAYFPRSLNTSKFRGEGSEFLASVTSAPHRRLKLEMGNSLTFRVPYANTLDWINLTDTDNTFGRLNIYCVSPLMGETSVEVADVTVRLRFADIELAVPTDSSLFEQKKYRELERQFLEDKPKNKTIPGLTAQMAEGEKTGPVTKIASAVATVGETLSGVPLIGKAAGMVGWFARGVAGVATAFGWSKPVDLVMPSATVAKPAAFMGNTEGKDASCVLAQIQDNAIENQSMTPADKDEMALSTIFRRPNMIGRITVPKSKFTQSALLFSWEVSPFNYLCQQQESNGQDFVLGTFSFTSLLYKLWRGSIKYSLSTVKTQYHSARVLAVYFPNRTRLDIPDTFNELMTSNSNMIYDLKAKADDDFSLEKPIVVPYSSQEPWKRTLWKNQNDLYDASTLNTCVGVIGVYCINELVCPPNVAQEVTFLLSVQAGDDYEVAIPQIQLQGGFAPLGPPQNPQAEIIALLTAKYASDQYVISGVTGTNPEIVDSQTDPQETTISQASAGAADWLLADGEAITLTDGFYTSEVDVTFTSASSLFTDGSYEFTVTVQDGLVTSLVSDYLTLANDATTPEAFSMTFNTPVVGPMRRKLAKRYYQAQMDDGATEPIASESTIATITSHHDVSQSTTGEYCKSLRPLMKRFIKTRTIPGRQAVSIQPADFVNYDSTTPVLPVGNRAWASDGNGGLVPESWLNLVSYIYRFFSGSVRSKVFIPFNVQATTSLDMSETLYTEFDTPLSDPVFVTQGVINNAVETTIPYYGQHRARTVGDELKGLGAKQRLYLSGAASFDYYEAAGDDASFWFLVGPPIMRPFDVAMTSVPEIKPS